MSLLLGVGAYAWDKNTSARAWAKDAGGGGAYMQGGGVLAGHYGTIISVHITIVSLTFGL